MLSINKFNECCGQGQLNTDTIANQLVRGGLNKKEAVAAVGNWKKGLLNPKPKLEDIQKLASLFSVDVKGLSDWKSSCMYAPYSARKARLVTALIAGRSVQEALDILKFTNKRATELVTKALKAAITNADEQQADVDRLYICEARVDDAGIRIGTKRWIAKDRGRAHAIRKKACHIHIKVTEI